MRKSSSLKSRDFFLLLESGVVRLSDFRKFFPNQEERSLLRTARLYMRPLELMGIATKNGDGWIVRYDVFEAVRRFLVAMQKAQWEGSLIEFLEAVFSETKEALEDSFTYKLSRRYGIDRKLLEEFIEELLLHLQPGSGEDLRRFVEELGRVKKTAKFCL